MNINQLKNSNDYMRKWFSAGAMRFFNTKIHGDVIADKFFIRSDVFDLKDNDESNRFYLVMEILEDGTLKTHGAHDEYKTIGKAEKFLNKLLKRAIENV